MTTERKESHPIVVVTGGTGYLAGHILETLFRDFSTSYRVRTTVRGHPSEDKYNYLLSLSAQYKQTLELYQANLLSAEGWDEAFNGATYIIHTASPVPRIQPDDENEVIGPALQGTRFVFEAAARAKTVKRVVFTGSASAIEGGRPAGLYTEDDWADLENANPYEKSKTIAEQFAWKFVGLDPMTRQSLPDFDADTVPFELVVLSPSGILGPLQNGKLPITHNALTGLLNNEAPMIPRLMFGLNDVRETSRIHVLALTNEEAKNDRFLLHTTDRWYSEIAEIVRREFEPQGYTLPSLDMPDSVAYVFSFFEKRLSSLPIGVEWRKDGDKARRVFNIETRPVEETIIDSVHSLIQNGLVNKDAGVCVML